MRAHARSPRDIAAELPQETKRVLDYWTGNDDGRAGWRVAEAVRGELGGRRRCASLSKFCRFERRAGMSEIPQATKTSAFAACATRLERYRALLKLCLAAPCQAQSCLLLTVVLGIASALAEGVGLSLIYPLLSSVLGSERHRRQACGSYIYSSLGRSRPTRLSRGFIFWRAYRVSPEGAACSLRHGATVTLLVGRLREDWSLAVLHSYLHGPYADIVAERRGRIMQKVVGRHCARAKGIEQLITLFVQAIFASRHDRHARPPELEDNAVDRR